MLAKETKDPFDDKAWMFEIKWDGYRAVAEIYNKNIKLYSRKGINFEHRYPFVARELKTIKERCVLDGEIVVLNDEGRPELQLLQHYGNNTHRPIQFYVFDLLSLDDNDTCALPLIERKELLKKIIKENEVIKYSDHIIGDGKSFFEVTKEKKLEGIIGKKCDSQYYKGKRTAEWLKIKHNQTREANLHLKDDKSIKEVNMANTLPIKETVLNKKKEETGNDKNKVYQFGKIKVTTSNPNKIYFPDDGVTKGDVINYYIEVSKYILPYLKGRPQSLLRNPSGINAKGFFHKDAGEEAPSYVKSKKVFSESGNKTIDYILCDNQPTLTYLNNLGCIEINPWHSTAEALDYPDYLIIDIDPSDNNNFEQVIEAANVVKQVFDKAGVTAYCKTSGASGLHVYVPTGKKYTYDQVKDFAYLVCMLAHEQIPGFTTLERNLKKRGNEHIYMDYLQNRRGQTIASVYSLRPKPGATVSTPLQWNEVKTGLTPKDFTIKNSLNRIKKTGDIFAGVLGKGIDINKCLKKIEI